MIPLEQKLLDLSHGMLPGLNGGARRSVQVGLGDQVVAVIRRLGQ